MTDANLANLMPSKHRRRWPLAVALAAVLLVAGGAAYIWWPRDITITGTVVLVSRDLQTDGQACAGRGGFADMREGATVAVRDGSGTTVALGKLGQGKWTATAECTFAFAVTVPADLDIYEITVGDRPGIQFSEAELADPVRIGIGR